jgi:N-acetyl-anhydromuramyl-L-alanine amidase AmpD/peptidoglycan hydrolase-like protein with peptidoglycan-binding domain
MHKQWFGCCADNFKSGRGGLKPEAIVIHRSGGSLTDLDARCNKPQAFSSAHYGVGPAGEVHQYVEETDTAFHAGIVVTPRANIVDVKPGVNPNLYTIAIEQAGSPGETLTDAQYEATAALICDIARVWKISLDSDHIVLHSDIRSGRVCPGEGFDPDRVLNLARSAAAQPANGAGARREVTALAAANVRAGAPSTKSRIVRVIPAGTTELAIGFTDRGERVQGNAYWYQAEDGNYFWAGQTNAPHPVQTESAPAVAAPAPAPQRVASARCGIQLVDDLLAGSPTAAAIGPGNSADAAIGAVQDLLTGQGFPGLPSVLSTAYGIFGQRTEDAVRSFQTKQLLEVTGAVDGTTLNRLVAVPAPDPRASQVYLSLALGFPSTGIHRILSLVAQMEGVGKFGAINRNTDRAGLSFGLIQWAQRPGRLAEILLAMSSADRQQFVDIFGDGDDRVADALIGHTRSLSGGVDPKTGVTMSAAFDLVNEPWITRFRTAAAVIRFQQVQVQTALAAFDSSYRALRRYAPEMVSERAVGFMLDVANQCGDAGTEKLYRSLHSPGMTETDLLKAIADATVARVDDNQKAGVQTRRDRFLETPLLSNALFISATGAGAGGGS